MWRLNTENRRDRFHLQSLEALRVLMIIFQQGWDQKSFVHPTSLSAKNSESQGTMLSTVLICNFVLSD